MDDNNIGAINVVEDIPWKHSEEPEELIEGKGFRLFESVHNAKVNEAGQLNRVQTMEAVFTSTFSRLFYGFSDFLTFMIEEDVYNDIGELLAQYVDSIECFLQVQIPEICRQKWRILHLRFGESCRLPGRIA